MGQTNIDTLKKRADRSWSNLSSRLDIHQPTNQPTDLPACLPGPAWDSHNRRWTGQSDFYLSSKSTKSINHHNMWYTANLLHCGAPRFIAWSAAKTLRYPQMADSSGIHTFESKLLERCDCFLITVITFRCRRWLQKYENWPTVQNKYLGFTLLTENPLQSAKEA